MSEHSASGYFIIHSRKQKYNQVWLPPHKLRNVLVTEKWTLKQFTQEAKESQALGC